MKGKVLLRSERLQHGTGLRIGGDRNVANLTGGAVGEAGLIVSSQVKITRTGTFVFPTRRQETQMAASSVCNLTLVLRYCTRGQKCMTESLNFIKQSISFLKQ